MLPLRIDHKLSSQMKRVNKEIRSEDLEPPTEPRAVRGAMQSNVLASLQYGLMSGLFVPGEVVSLRKLAASLGTSLMPVRESLSRLVAASALEELPNRSVRVPRLDAQSLEELFELRVRVEGLATRLATSVIDDAAIEKLEQLNRAVKAAHDASAMGELLQANQRFHFYLYRLTRSSVLLPMIEGLWLRVGPTMFFSLSTPGLWDSSSHLGILSALKQRDPDKAEKAMARDIMKTGKVLIQQAREGMRTGPTAMLSMRPFKTGDDD
ncbi:GntR family transcriptional regulator [Ancylobacter oerskovii]|uniref:GntR family transcriptional regulator n=1 Tax=Ancylobacter oerskovii TaxID=459519 RepID=A0ABW4YU99_9HYPH|nr:GntR family transcriptional regulator [Ancylobacter oerskovii]MBS7544613.1 GntR family transcriptional regulator [Ancylobacter oerskovii]